MSHPSPPSRHPAYSTVVRACSALATAASPVVTGKTLTTLSGTSSILCISLFIFLECLTSAGVPLPALNSLLATYGRPGFRLALWNVVRVRYEGLRDCDLEADPADLRATATAAYPGVDIESLLAFYVAAAVKAGQSTSEGVLALAGRLRDDKSETAMLPVPREDGAAPDPAPQASKGSPSARGELDLSGRVAAEEAPANAGAAPQAWRATEAIHVLTEQVYDPDVMPPESEAARAFVGMLRALRRL